MYIDFSLFPSLHSDFTEYAVDWLQAQPVEIISDPVLMEHARAVLADAVILYRERFQKSKVCLVYMYDLQGSAEPWSTADGLYTNRLGDQADTQYAVVGLDKSIFSVSDEYAIGVLIHELIHGLTAEQQYAVNLPHDQSFEELLEGFVTYYEMQTGRTIDLVE